jgi:hypothetical protein
MFVLELLQFESFHCFHGSPETCLADLLWLLFAFEYPLFQPAPLNALYLSMCLQRGPLILWWDPRHNGYGV